MALIRIDRNPSGRALALFGALWLVFFAVAAALLWRSGAPRPFAVVVAII